MIFIVTRTSLPEDKRPHPKALQSIPLGHWAMNINSLDHLISLIHKDESADYIGVIVSRDKNDRLTLEFYDRWRE